MGSMSVAGLVLNATNSSVIAMNITNNGTFTANFTGYRISAFVAYSYNCSISINTT